MKISTRFLQRDNSLAEKLVRKTIDNISLGLVDKISGLDLLSLASSGLTGAGISVNNFCNFSCPYCYIKDQSWFKELQGSTFSPELLYFSTKAAAKAVDYFIIPAMEPFVNEESTRKTLEMCRIGKEEGIVTSVITNASGLTRLSFNQIEYIKDVVDDIGISLDSANQEINDSLRGKETFQQTLAGLDRLIQSGYSPNKISILTTLSQAKEQISSESITEHLEFASRYKFGRLSIGACVLGEKTPSASSYYKLWFEIIQSYMFQMTENSPKIVFYSIFENPASVIGLIQVAKEQSIWGEATYNPIEHAMLIPFDKKIPMFAQITPLPFELVGFPRITGRNVGRCFDYMHNQQPVTIVSDEDYFVRIDQKLREKKLDNETRPLIESEVSFARQIMSKYSRLLTN